VSNKSLQAYQLVGVVTVRPWLSECSTDAVAAVMQLASHTITLPKPELALPYYCCHPTSAHAEHLKAALQCRPGNCCITLFGFVKSNTRALHHSCHLTCQTQKA
jgi:hypothetical protein